MNTLSNVPSTPSQTVVINSFDSLVQGLATVPSRTPSKEKGSTPHVSFTDVALHIAEIGKCPRTIRIANRLLYGLWGTTSRVADPAMLRSVEHRACWFRTLAELFYHFLPFPKFNILNDLLVALRASQNWPLGEEVKYIKYFCIAPHARFFQNPLPDRPSSLKGGSSWRIFGGPLGRWMSHRILQTKSVFCQKFFYSWFQSKRGCLEMDEIDVMETYVKHKKALSRIADPLPDWVSRRIPIFTQRILAGRKNKKTGLKDGLRVKIPDSVDYELSHHACFQNTIKGGGALQQVQDDLLRITTSMDAQSNWYYRTAEECLRDVTPKEREEIISIHHQIRLNSLDGSYRRIRSRYLTGWLRNPCELVLRDLFRDESLVLIMLQFLVEHDEVFEAFPEPQLEHIEQQFECGGEDEFVGMKDRRCLRKIDYLTLLGLACTRHTAGVMVAPVLEPLKVRLVSKGDAYTYAASMPMQRQLHGFLRRYQVFSLIGEPPATKHFDWLSQHDTTRWIEKVGERLGHGELKWNSGDYSAATDGLSIEVTKLIFETVLPLVEDHSCRTEFVDMCRHVLYEQMIHYPIRGKKAKQADLEPFWQTCGQLMGSTLSFPVLCIANLIGYWLALEQYYQECVQELDDQGVDPQDFGMPQRIGLRELAVLINGDDLLAGMNDRFYSIWTDTIKHLGFVLSPGKSLFHRSLATVNSQQWYFKWNGSLDQGKWFYTPYLNLGLIIRGSCGKIARAVGPTNDFSAVWNKAKEGCIDEKAGFSRFLHFHGEMIKKQTHGGLLNMFGSCQSGGLGFDVPGEWTYKFTRLQRALAYDRHIANRNHVVKKPVVARVKLDVSFMNFTDVRQSSWFVPCEGEGDEMVFPQHLIESGFVPQLDSEESANTCVERYEAYQKVLEPGSLDSYIIYPDGFNPMTGEIGRKFVSATIGECLPLIKNRKLWRNRQLASLEQMFHVYNYIPVIQARSWPEGVGETQTLNAEIS